MLQKRRRPAASRLVFQFSSPFQCGQIVGRDLQRMVVRVESLFRPAQSRKRDSVERPELGTWSGSFQLRRKKLTSLLEIPLAYVLALKLGAKAGGVYWSILVAETAAGLVGIAMFRRGKWKRIQV